MNHRPPHSTPTIARRSLLAGGLGFAGAAALSACSSGKSSSTPTTGNLALTSDGPNAKDQLSLLQIFPSDVPYAYAGAPQRLDLALGNSEGAFLDTGPSTLRFTITDSAQKPVGAPIDVALHDKDLQKGYYPLVFNPPKPGTYTATARTGGQNLTAVFKVWDKAQVQIPGPGDKMPAVATPTVADRRGVDPICTASPQCPLHTVSLDAALAQHRPVAFLIATPAYCQTAVCGPVLDVLVKSHASHGDRITMIHNEVYKSGAAAAKGQRGQSNLTPALGAMKLTFEPSLVLVRPDRTILRRLDTVYDSTELEKSLNDLVA